MLPDYPDYKSLLISRLLDWMKREMARHEPILGAVSHFKMHEGVAGTIKRSDGSSFEFELHEASSVIELSREEMRRPNLQTLFNRVSEMASEIAGQEAARMFQEIDQVVTAAGNVTDHGGRPFDKEVLLAELEKVEISFDLESGQPNGLSLFVHPSKEKEFREALAKMEQDHEFRARYAQIMDRKREEWFARESRRTLVD